MAYVVAREPSAGFAEMSVPAKSSSDGLIHDKVTCERPGSAARSDTSLGAMNSIVDKPSYSYLISAGLFKKRATEPVRQELPLFVLFIKADHCSEVPV